MTICKAAYDIVNLRTSKYYDLLTWSVIEYSNTCSAIVWQHQLLGMFQV